MSLIVFIAVLLILPSVGEAQPHKITCGPNKTIGSSLKILKPGDTFIVSGTCNENVRIPEEAHGITLDCQGTATIDGPDATLATINVRARGVTIKDCTVTGGRTGIGVRGNASAIIDGCTIEDTGNRGVDVVRSSSARIVNSTIQNNPGDGIRASGNSTIRVGFLSGRVTTVTFPNEIVDNGGDGVRVDRTSSARVVSNNISDNDGNGIQVRRGSNADIADNDIDGNGGSGIRVRQNSGVNLAIGSNLFGTDNRTDAADKNSRAGVTARSIHTPMVASGLLMVPVRAQKSSVPPVSTACDLV